MIEESLRIVVDEKRFLQPLGIGGEGTELRGREHRSCGRPVDLIEAYSVTQFPFAENAAPTKEDEVAETQLQLDAYCCLVLSSTFTTWQVFKG